jgi:hypothetical protein
MKNEAGQVESLSPDLKKKNKMMIRRKKRRGR